MTHDWQKLVSEISATGMSDYKIAQCLGIHHLQLHRIKLGSEPKHSVGELLLALHRLMVTRETVQMYM